MANTNYKGIEKALRDVTFLSLQSKQNPVRYSLFNFTLGDFPLKDRSLIGGFIGNKEEALQMISLGNYGKAGKDMINGYGLGNYGKAEGNMFNLIGSGNYGKAGKDMINLIGLGNYGKAGKDMINLIGLGNYGKAGNQMGGLFSVSKNAKTQESLFNLDFGKEKTAQAGLINYSMNEGISLIRNNTYVLNQFKKICNESFENQNKKKLHNLYEKYVKKAKKPLFISKNYLRARAFRKELSDFVPESIEIVPKKEKEKKYRFSFYNNA